MSNQVTKYEYNGHLFQSILEARWAAFFDVCRINWEYKPKSFPVRNRRAFTPDFLLHGVEGRGSKELFVVVRGTGTMTDADAENIRSFVYGDGNSIEHPLLVVSDLPEGDDAWDISQYFSDEGYSAYSGIKYSIYPFNFEMIDGDHFAAHPGINKNGGFELFGDDSSYLRNQNDKATEAAFTAANRVEIQIEIIEEEEEYTMNLKESFRYQSFLESLMNCAKASLYNQENCLNTTKLHKRKEANPAVEDMEEIVEKTETYIPADTIISFMEFLVAEREKLTEAIGKAKASIGFDLDAAVETNKFRQGVNGSIKKMLNFKASKKTEHGRAYKFNESGDQVSYVYDVDMVVTEAYNRDNAKAVMRKMISDADKVSAQIDAAMINTTVNYEPPYDVNETFNDVMEHFMAESAGTLAG